jgi:hypothetical protein
MKKPRIYGHESRLRAALMRATRSGEELLAQTEGTRKRMKLVEESKLDALAIEQQWEADFRRWFMSTGNLLFKYLQEQLNPPWNSASGEDDVLPTLSNGLPPDDGKPRHSIGIDNGEAWLSKTLDELRELQVALGEPKKVTARTKEPSRRSLLSLLSNPVVVVLGIIGSVASVVGLVLAIIVLSH